MHGYHVREDSRRRRFYFRIVDPEKRIQFMSRAIERFSLVAAFALCIVGGSVAQVSFAPASRAEAPAGFAKVFMTASDLPKGFKQTEEHLSLADNPPEFKKCKGQGSGLRVFQADSAATLQRIVDIRWTFPTAADAQAFFDATHKSLAEGSPLIANAKPVGDSCKVYGGENQMAAMMGGDSFNQYYYIVRVGRVVAKIYGSEGPAATSHPTVQMMLPVAQAAAKRCAGY